MTSDALLLTNTITISRVNYAFIVIIIPVFNGAFETEFDTDKVSGGAHVDPEGGVDNPDSSSRDICVMNPATNEFLYVSG